MKNLATLFLLFVSLSISALAQPVTIPDASFRSRVLSQVSGTSEVGNQVVFTTPAVTDVTALDLSFASITDLTGIEAFAGLVSLNCGFNPSLGVIDVSNNLLLEELSVFSCGLSGTLDLTSNPALRFLSVQLNSLTGIDISNCPLLEEFNCNFNQLTALDMTNKPLLRSFACQENQISSLDVTGSPLLRFFICSINNISALDVSQNPQLEQFRCNVNNISVLDLSNNPLLSGEFNCSDNQITSLDLSQSTGIERIFCFGNQLTSLVIGNNTTVNYIDCNSNALTSLDVSNCTSLEELYCNDNQITSLDLSANPLLKVLFCFRNQLTNLDLNVNLALERLECGFNQITNLVGLGANMFSLACQDNLLTSINVTNCPTLEFLEVQNNALTSLDVSTNPMLFRLFCWNNQLTLLNVNGCANLNGLSCEDNQLTTLDLTSNVGLSQLNAARNALTTLVIGNKPGLSFLNFRDNQVSSVDLSNAPILSFLLCANNQLTQLDAGNSPVTFLRAEGNRIPIVLTSITPISSVVIDPFTQLAVKRSASLSPTIAAGETGAFVLGTTGAIVNLTANSSPAASLTSSTGVSPITIPPLPIGVQNVSPDQFWTVTQSGLTSYTYNLILDLSSITNIGNFNTLKVLKRPNSSAPWQDVAQAPISATVQYLEPFILVNGLTEFSDFAVGGDSDNPLPVQLSRFTGGSTPSGVALAWTTASEADNAGFGVLRDGVEIASFRNTPALRGRGTTSETTQYVFTDASVEVGRTYQYALRSYDFNGTVHDYPNTVSVEVTEISRRIFRYELSQNFPNPFNPTTLIEYELASAGDVRLEVFDMLGRKVATLVNERQSAGAHRANFNASNLSSGVYFYTIQSGRFSQTKKMLLVK